MKGAGMSVLYKDDDILREKKRCAAVIVAAGSGTRMGGTIPKQFLEIAGRPVLAYTLAAFEASSYIDSIIIVTGKESIGYCREEIAGKYGFNKVNAIVSGGPARCYSVLNGLKACPDDTEYVFIHDGVRAMISGDVIARGYEEVLKYGSAVASMISKDTVRITDEGGNVIMTPERKNVRCMQTPQIFSFGPLLDAYLKMTDEEMNTFTDDAYVWEHFRKEKLHLYDGSPENIKITTPEDLVYAEKVLKRK